MVDTFGQTHCQVSQGHPSDRLNGPAGEDGVEPDCHEAQTLHS